MENFAVWWQPYVKRRTAVWWRNPRFGGSPILVAGPRFDEEIADLMVDKQTSMMRRSRNHTVYTSPASDGPDDEVVLRRGL